MPIYMKIDGIDGEFQDKDHKNWCILTSFNQSAQKTGGGATGASRNVGDVVFNDLVVTKELDKASPNIQKAMANGKAIPKVEVHITASVTDTGRTPYLTYEFKDVYITSYNLGGQSESRPMEQIAMNYEQFKVTYNEVDKSGKGKGKVDFGWDVSEGKPA